MYIRYINYTAQCWKLQYKSRNQATGSNVCYMVQPVKLQLKTSDPSSWFQRKLYCTSVGKSMTVAFQRIAEVRLGKYVSCRSMQLYA